MGIENDLIKAKAHIDMALIEAETKDKNWTNGYFAGKDEAQRTQQLLADQLAAAKKELEEELRLNEDRRAMFVALRTKNEELRAQVRAREAAREEALRNSVSRAAFDELRARNDLLRTEHAANKTKIYQLQRERVAAQARYEEYNGWFIASRTERDELRTTVQSLRSELAELRAKTTAQFSASEYQQRINNQWSLIQALRSEHAAMAAKLDAAEGRSQFSEADDQYYEARIMRQRETIMELRAKLDAIKAAAS